MGDSPSQCFAKWLISPAINKQEVDGGARVDSMMKHGGISDLPYCCWVVLFAGDSAGKLRSRPHGDLAGISSAVRWWHVFRAAIALSYKHLGLGTRVKVTLLTD